jgi:hypothetical protein
MYSKLHVKRQLGEFNYSPSALNHLSNQTSGNNFYECIGGWLQVLRQVNIFSEHSAEQNQQSDNRSLIILSKDIFELYGLIHRIIIRSSNSAGSKQ